MIHENRHLLQLLLIYITALILGILICQHTGFYLVPEVYASLLSAMTIVTAGSYLLVRKGVSKGGQQGGVYLIAGLGGKFLAYLIIILVFWAVVKNLAMEFIIAFFVLYLVLTLFLISILLKMLKTK
ncbi:MAG: hypothetical protein K9J30_02235 [Bacteroidales bacterium]|nr:hypothetical protein [Bacteroidales bacterium]